MTEDPKPLPEGLETLPRIDEARIRFLWHFDWWDGPLNGLAEYDGQKAWFAYHGMDDPGCHYFYRLYLLTDAQAAEAELWRATRGDWSQETGVWLGRDESRHNPDWVSPVLPNQQPAGWFYDGSNASFYQIQVTYD